MRKSVMQRHHRENFHPPGMTFLTEVAEAGWIEPGTNHDSRGIDALIPAGFAAHARLFHPADNVSGSTLGSRVKWSEVAKWAGRTVHPLMAFEQIKVPATGFGVDPAPWKYDPDEELYDVGIALADFLAGYTDTPLDCFFGVWEGYGQLGVGSMFMLSTDGGVPLSPPAEVLSAERFICDDGEYLLYRGALDAMDSFYTVPIWCNLPNIWWPADRAWFVVSHYDLNSTYVAGSEECIRALLAHPYFEVLPVAANAPFGWGQDQINLS